jgi:thioredoxin reductase
MIEDFDVLIVGGGPAGSSAALLLGRCRLRVLVCSNEIYRNRASQAIHALLCHEGQSPAEFLSCARAEVAKYDTVVQRSTTVVRIGKCGERFTFTCSDGSAGTAARVLLATGITDELPDLPGVADFYGISVHHCLYCDGYEHRDQPLVAYGKPKKALGLALMMLQWSADVVVCTDGQGSFGTDELEKACRFGLTVDDRKISGLSGENGRLDAIHFADGGRKVCRGFFFSTGCHQTSSLAHDLGCKRDEKGGIIVDPETESSSVAGVYIAGDASRDVLLVAAAIGEGVKAAVAINRSLLKAKGLI